MAARSTNVVQVLRRIAVLATATCALWSAGSAHAAGARSTPDQKTRIADLQAVCTPQVLGKAVARVSPTMTVGEIPNILQRLTSGVIVAAAIPGGARYVPAAGKIPAYCEFTGTFVTNVKTGKTAHYIATLPQAWNGKYLQFGCGGNCGHVRTIEDYSNPHAMEGYPLDPLVRGYATFGTDGGHDSSNSFWAVTPEGKPNQDAIEDWAWRAAKKLAVAGKQATVNIYELATGRRREIERAYFNGAGGGGRDVLIAATRYPQEFDGIIAGDPVLDPAGLGMYLIGMGLGQIRSQGAYVPDYLLARVNGVVKARCDGKDGLVDDIIQNPAACDFRADRDLPRCDGTQAVTRCFTAEQIRTLSVAMSAVTDENGAIVHPGVSIGEFYLPHETFKLKPWPKDIAAAEPYPPGGPMHGLWSLGEPVLRYMAFADVPGYTHRSLFRFEDGTKGQVDSYHAVVPAKMAALAAERTKSARVDPPERLAKFIRRDGKLLIWLGLADRMLSPYGMVNYYRKAASRFGGYDALQKNVRLFGLPGVSEGRGDGPGPKNFDSLTAMEDWVERGQAPETMLATLYDVDDPEAIVGKQATRTMPLCMYPAMARYRGTGDINEAKNWSCLAGDRSMLAVGEAGRLAGVQE
ncbi:tannase/feruloyl esterase family alpha/beta hydrolase [Novosphingobium malaysiense]|uniref:Tannase n=1 Tax=Novosphingobium malaysiense TaxID=1348853 RepID=A0A0B1ZIH8_9SPHN|nr:tannase/feruloyl esterase family alpha/beta hydrolase [Novosphingobium malaysiense]KHK90332.1 hypothetical protein LK12_17115 [Novosphingobium malaysiense]